MTAAEKMEALMKTRSDAQLIDTYKDVLRMRHGDLAAKYDAQFDELGIVIRFAEVEMDRREIDVESIITEVLSR